VKVAFPLTVKPEVATYEIPYATLERSTKRDTPWEKARYEVPAQKWADLSENGFGVSILNEAKYGYDALDNVIRLTCFRAPKSPDPTADRGIHDFTYAIFPHAGDWRAGGTVRAAYELNHPLVVGAAGAPGTAAPGSAAQRNDPFSRQWGGPSYARNDGSETAGIVHSDGGAPDPPAGIARAPRARPAITKIVELQQKVADAAEGSFVSCDAANVIIPVLKGAERADAIVVRAVEIEGKEKTTATLRFPFRIASASLVNLLEEDPRPIDFEGNSVRVNCGAYAMETILVTPSR
jgi:alpha-mannosidase